MSKLWIYFHFCYNNFSVFIITWSGNLTKLLFTKDFKLFTFFFNFNEIGVTELNSSLVTLFSLLYSSALIKKIMLLELFIIRFNTHVYNSSILPCMLRSFYCFNSILPTGFTFFNYPLYCFSYFVKSLYLSYVSLT